MTTVIGLTGGMGSGKTAAARYFAAQGVPIIDADEIARDCVSPGSATLATIIAHFGSHLLLQDGELNRSALRQFIFDHPEERKWLEGLLHPLIYQTMVARLKDIQADYCVLVIPLLAEFFSTYRSLLDHVVVIDVSEATQLERIVARDHADPSLIQKMISAQADRQQRLNIADSVILNDGSLQELKTKITNFYESMLLSK